jgi:hypothetical protein
MAANPFLFNQLDVLGLVNRTPQGVTFTSVALMSANDSFSRMIIIQPMLCYKSNPLLSQPNAGTKLSHGAPVESNRIKPSQGSIRTN